MSEWIEWKGGECPVTPSSRVDIRTLSEGEWVNIPADYPHWDLKDDPFTIIAYRPSKAPNTHKEGE